MRLALSLFGAVVLGALGPAAHSASLTAVLGDSLSDPCNLWTLDPSAVPNPPYPDRQFTNGNTWATQLGSNCASGANFAYGGATAVLNPSNPVRGLDTLPSSGITPTPNVPDLEQQAELYKASPVGQASDADFLAIWIGANDLFNTLEANQSNPIELPAKLAETTAAVVSTVAEVIADLAITNPPNVEFVLFGLPSLGKTPLINILPAPVPALMDLTTAALNDAFEAVVSDFQGLGIPITYFDIEFYFEEIINDPAAFGLTNVTDACTDNPLCGTSIDPNTYLFFDKVHPSQAVHTIILDEYKSLVPIPLPAGLPLYLTVLAALGMIGLGRGCSGSFKPSGKSIT